jgi:hypothetical protein
MLPSGPAVIEKGVLFAVGIENSVTLRLGISNLLLMPRYKRAFQLVSDLRQVCTVRGNWPV